MEPCKKLTYADVAVLIETAAAAFWNVFSSSFPELTSGDSQMVDEDKAALGLWFVGDGGEDNAVVRSGAIFDPVHEQFTDERIARCVYEGAQAALKVWNDAGMPAPSQGKLPADIAFQLEANVRHVLWANHRHE